MTSGLSDAGMARIEVRFLIDANGILNVTARDARTGKGQSVEVKPSYGLTEEQVEAMIVESFENTNLALAARNNPRLVLVDPLHVNVYDVVNSRYIVLSQDALQRLTEALES